MHREQAVVAEVQGGNDELGAWCLVLCAWYFVVLKS
jgi:hypothetical protein